MGKCFYFFWGSLTIIFYFFVSCFGINNSPHPHLVPPFVVTPKPPQAITSIVENTRRRTYITGNTKIDGIKHIPAIPLVTSPYGEKSQTDSLVAQGAFLYECCQMYPASLFFRSKSFKGNGLSI